MASDSNTAKAFAPATVGNIGVGFDILGHALDSVGDAVTVTRIEDAEIHIAEITGTVTDLPTEPRKNTATAGLVLLCEELELDHGFEVRIDKGIPLGSGMGGSAASSVAAILAANALIDEPLDQTSLLRMALKGEALTGGGTVHADNVAPSLIGGLVLSSIGSPPSVTRIPVPNGLFCVLVHPDIVVETRESRDGLSHQIPHEAFVQQTSNLAGFLAGCFTHDLNLIARSLRDVAIEPQRAPAIEGFAEVKRGALNAGALGCSISGSGPSVFAWCRHGDSRIVADAMLDGFGTAGVAAEYWISAVDAPGARLVEP